MASSLKSTHHWNSADNLQLLKSLSLHQKNNITGEEGFTLAAILLFGTDETIASALPAFKIDLIKRVDNPERYDDRITLRTNLLDCYERSIEFVNKHLPDSFYMEEGRRKSLRELIFREIVSNMIVHKEYSFGEATRLIIEKDRIFTENSNRPRVNGIVDQNCLGIYPKNPNICKLFREIGIVEDLGSGFANLYKYCNQYNGSNPIIKDEHIFSVELSVPFFTAQRDKIQITPQVHEQASDQAEVVTDQVINQASNQVERLKTEQITGGSLFSDQASDQATKILNFCSDPKKLSEIINHIGFKNRVYFKRMFVQPLIEKGLLVPTISDKPTSPLQKYVKNKT
jgi:ATP-dependent DNA helicase RecG